MPLMSENLVAITILVAITEVLLLIIVFWGLDRLLLAATRFLERSPVLGGLNRSQLRSARRLLREILLAIFGLLVFLVLSFNGWLLYGEENAFVYLLSLADTIPESYWRQVLQGLLKSLLLLLVTSLLLRIARQLLQGACNKAKAFEQVTSNDESIERFFSALSHFVTSGAWGLALILSAGFLGIPETVTQFMVTAFRIYVLIAAGLLAVQVVTVVVDSFDAISIKYSGSSTDNLLRFYDSLRYLVPLFKRCLEYGIYVFTATLVLDQIDWVARLSGLGLQVIQVISIFFVSRVLVAVASLIIEEVLVNARNLSEIQRQRRMTMAPLLRSTSKYIIYFGAVVGSLYALDVNPAPILAGAGIIGLTLSLGAQNLVNDIVSGFFILFESYYLVGDYIATNETEGIVEAIELRTTRIRHPDGQVQIVRNGNIESVRNYSMEYVYAVVLVNLDYEENLDQVYQVIAAVGEQLLHDHEEVLEPPDLEGVDKFEEETLAVRVRTKVKPGQHLRIERLLRQRIKAAFDREGIMITPREKFILEYGQLSANLNFDRSSLRDADPDVAIKLPSEPSEETS